MYDWVIDKTRVSERHGFSRPHQYEFARLNLDYTVLSKRKLLALVEEGYVNGWEIDGCQRSPRCAAEALP